MRIPRMLAGNKVPDCAQVRRTSSNYLEGDLDSHRSLLVKAHLDHCGPCRAFLDTLKATIALLSSTQCRKAPHSLRTRVMQQVRQEKAR